ncbi:GAF domain-containing sensor histidine kinase [Phaeocystidibacter luteus]|uniref:histidine kinase n=1 Tax=Phaeocystidibacter luteus TaxID=911197 RepID=A0A6N6RKD5_9FLAO|nr:GAF domain-containing sensor histidine kinase [Phaeocystidibacter luteus]KAB2805381.1 GAF domain-containing sensor histidine kinase [Phaeocystidibacter luteus]
MIVPSRPQNDFSRAQAAEEFKRISEEEKSALEEIVDLASRICGTKMAMVTFVTEEVQYLQAAKNLDVSTTPRDLAFCSHTILGDDLFQVKDTWEDERFHDNPYVRDNPNIRFYAGMPLETVNGIKLGALCVIDSEPGGLTDAQSEALRILSTQVMKRLELSKTQRELEEQNHRLTRINALRSKLINVMAHDIRGPLSSIRVVVDMMSEGSFTPEEMIDFGDTVDEVIQQTDDFLNNILEWGKVMSVDENEAATQVNVSEMIEDIAELSSIQAKLKNLTIVADVESDLHVHMSKNVFMLALRNLLGNAIKFSENNEIRISAERTEDKILTLRVTDHGVGMTEERKSQILDGELLTSKSGTRGEKGTGIGLSFVVDMLDKVNAKMDININADGGCTFSVDFPIS